MKQDADAATEQHSPQHLEDFLWGDREGTLHDVRDIDDSYLYNLYHFLTSRNVYTRAYPTIHERYLALPRWFKLWMPVRNLLWRVTHPFWTPNP